MILVGVILTTLKVDECVGTFDGCEEVVLTAILLCRAPRAAEGLGTILTGNKAYLGDVVGNLEGCTVVAVLVESPLPALTVLTVPPYPDVTLGHICVLVVPEEGDAVVAFDLLCAGLVGIRNLLGRAAVTTVATVAGVTAVTAVSCTGVLTGIILVKVFLVEVLVADEGLKSLAGNHAEEHHDHENEGY